MLSTDISQFEFYISESGHFSQKSIEFETPLSNFDKVFSGEMKQPVKFELKVENRINSGKSGHFIERTKFSNERNA